jgi:hypothetical protein
MLKRIGVGVVLALLLIPWPTPVIAAPPAQAGCAGNVLANPGFEEGFPIRGVPEITVAAGWDPWWVAGTDAQASEGFLSRPDFKPVLVSQNASRVHSGQSSQRVTAAFATYSAGLVQRVSVVPDSTLTLTAWALAWSTQDPLSTTAVNPGDLRVSIGIDPTGGTDGGSPSIVWCPEVIQYGTWLNLTVQARAQGSTISVFLRGRPEYRVQMNDSFWDDVCLLVTAPTAIPTPLPPLATATRTSTTTLTPTITPVPTVKPATVRVYAFQDYNNNGQRDSGDALLPGAVFTLTTAAGTAVGTYTTDGLGEPHDFPGLPAGSYKLTAKPPLGYVAVGSDSWASTLAVGQVWEVGFAANFSPSPTPTVRPAATMTAPPPAPTATPTPAPAIGTDFTTSLYGVSGLIVMVLAAAMLVVVQVAKRRA